MGPDDIAPNLSPVEGATDRQPWTAPEVRTLAASGAEFGGGAVPDLEGTS